MHLTSRQVCLAQRRRPHHPVERSNPYLECIRYISSWWGRESCDSTSKPPTNVSYQARLKDIICASRNLETLKLIRTEHTTDSSKNRVITLQKGDIMPRLKHLHLAFLDFDEVQSHLWAEALQWELLHSLSLINVNWNHLFPCISGRFRFLKSLEISMSKSFNCPGWRHSNESFDPPPLYWERTSHLRLLLESMPPLENFVGYHVPQIILGTLSTYHHSLKHLRFRSPKRQHYMLGECPWPSSIEDLPSLPDKFPDLESLGLDLDWTHNEWVS